MDSKPQATHKDVALIYHPAFLEHATGYHPESAERLRAILSALAKQGIHESDLQTPTPIDPAILAEVHSSDYVSEVEKLARSGGGHWDLDTYISPRSFSAAQLAAGAAAAAVDTAMAGEKLAFALVRPPGHHALQNSAMGFCIFNNIAVAAHYATRRYGVEKVLIVDWDVHHGNGTQDLMYERPDVLFFSTHQYPFYPGSGAIGETGRGPGEGYTVNVPLPAGAADDEYLNVFREVLAPVAHRYKPQLILVSAGYDAHMADPIGGMVISTPGFAQMARVVRELADEVEECGGRLAAILEGGYNVGALASSVVATIDAFEAPEHISPLAGQATSSLPGRMQWRHAPDIGHIIRDVRRAHRLADADM